MTDVESAKLITQSTGTVAVLIRGEYEEATPIAVYPTQEDAEAALGLLDTLGIPGSFLIQEVPAFGFEA